MWEANHKKIQKAYIDLLHEGVQFPRITEIAAKSGFCYNTVKYHLDQWNLGKIAKEMKLQTEAVLQGIGMKAAAGDAACAKIWLQIVAQFSEKTIVENRNTNEVTEELTFEQAYELKYGRKPDADR